MRTSFDEYRKIPAVNWSTLKSMRRSPLQYLHDLSVEREDTTGFIFGGGAHCMILEPEKFDAEYAVFDGPTRRGKAWDAFAEANADRRILKVSEYEAVVAVRDAVMRHPLAKQHLTGGVAEQKLEWIDPATGLACKGLVDYVTRRAYVDLKTTGDIDLRKFGALAARMGYHGQLAFYGAGLRATTGATRDAYIIAVEKDAPHDVGVFKLSKEDLTAGTDECAQLMARVAECRASGVWPGRYVEEQTLQLPTWIRDEEVDAEEFAPAESSMGEGL